MVESSMVDSVLQLFCRWAGSVARPPFARFVPAGRVARRRAARGAVAFGLCGLLQPAATAWCIPAPQEAPAAPVAAVGDAGRPSVEAALDAFLAARRWLDADELPEPEADAAKVALPATDAVSVTLRLDGRIVGTGEDAGADGAMLRRAVGRAISRALGDDTIRAVRAAAGDRVTHRLSLEVELAGPLRPLLGRTIDEAARRVAPGIDGVAVRRGERVARAFPGRLLSIDSAERPEKTVTSLLVELGLPPQDLPAFRAEDRVSLARFATTRLVQAGPKDAPAEIARAGAPIGRSEITAGTTALLATQLGARLAAQVVPADERDPTGEARLLGTLNPTADRFDPPFASDREAAYTAWSLAAAAKSDSVAAPVRERAASAAHRLAKSLALSRLAGTGSPPADAVDALALLALAHLGDLQGVALARPRVEALVTSSLEDDASGTNAEPESVAFGALALVEAAQAGGVPVPPEVDAAVRRLLERNAATRGRLVDAFEPLALLARRGALAAETQVALDSTLVETAGVLRGFQIDAQDGASGFPSDLDGGLALPARRSQGVDAQGIRVGVGLAAIAAGPENDSATARAAVAGIVRFLAQHVADSPWVDTLRNPARTRGMVRNSLWTDDLPPGASAAGLRLAVEAIDVLRRPESPEPAAPAAP